MQEQFTFLKQIRANMVVKFSNNYFEEELYKIGHNYNKNIFWNADTPWSLYNFYIISLLALNLEFQKKLL